MNRREMLKLSMAALLGSDFHATNPATCWVAIDPGAADQLDTVTYFSGGNRSGRTTAMIHEFMRYTVEDFTRAAKNFDLTIMPGSERGR